MKNLLLPLSCFLLLSLQAFAQGENRNWYMGRKAGMQFNGNAKPIAIFDSEMLAYGSSVSVSDANGQLLFYTDGKKVYNRNHLPMDNSDNIVSDPSQYKWRVVYLHLRGTSRYLVFVGGTTPEYFEIDMSLAGGLGSVTRKRQALDPGFIGTISGLTVINNCRDNAYWLVAMSNQSQIARVYRVYEGGTLSQPILCDLGVSIFQTGDIAVSMDGSRVAISSFIQTNPFILICAFDKVCGKLSPLMELSVSNPDAEYAYGLEFSRSGQFLYVAYSVAISQLYQFDLFSADPNLNPYLIATDPSNFNQLQMGPDGRIYISTHWGGIPGARIDAITDPDKKGADCKYQYAYLDLGRATEFELPWFPADIEQECAIFPKPIIGISNTCLGFPTLLSLNPQFSPDSFYWDPGVSGAPVSRQPNFSYTYPAAGNYTVRLIWYKCGLTDTTFKQVTIGSKPVFELGSDTTICAGTGFWLYAGDFPGARFTWSTGETTPQIFVSTPGSYSLTIAYGDCSATDTRVVKQWPSLWATLGKEYFLCEEEGGLVKLDAGKGFDQYKWTPTGDTSQWIIVEKTGPYFVMVTDWRGCSTESGTQVKRRCPVYLHVPNAFTPDGDGLNEFFAPVGLDITQYRLEIYNIWGARVFVSDNPGVGWDGTFKGKNCPDGVYHWKLDYQGFEEDKLRNYTRSGVVHLLR